MKSVLTSGLLTLLTAFTLAVSLPTYGATGPHLIAQEGDVAVRLFLGDCVTRKGVFVQATPEDVKEFKEATVVFEGKEYDACWRDVDSSTVFIIDETGDQGALPKSLFKKPDVI